MQQILLVLHLLICIALIGLVLVQQGKGSDLGAAMGAGASNTMFGSQGATPFLMKVTYTLAGLFFFTSLLLAFSVAHTTHQQPSSQYEISKELLQQQSPALPAPQKTSLPAAPQTL